MSKLQHTTNAHSYLLTIFIVLFLQTSFAQKTNKYPHPPKDSSFDTYFDTIINDPYQWMENPKDPRLAEWLDSQEKIKKKEGH